MKKIIGILTFALVALSSCSKDAEDPVTDCLQDKLLTFDTNVACNNGATVKEYTFQNKTVFAFDPGVCGADLTTEVLNESCGTIGYLGGITNNDTIAGDHFGNTAVFVRQIWGN
ncbi:MAG TPA: hypothetical protein EYG86_08345 [Crocinitomicaceae bacterium]|nr:hypothetical protein [Crocinitomicaceae bacterium]